MERKRPESGEIYTHFKGKRYKVLQIARHTETEEELVVYQALYGDHGIYARPLDMFLSPVDTQKYPESSQKYRFEQSKFLSSEREVQEQPKEEQIDELSMILEFLDLETSQEKMNYMQRFRLKLTERFLNAASESLGCTEAGDTLEMRYEGIIKYLSMKIRYETGRLR